MVDAQDARLTPRADTVTNADAATTIGPHRVICGDITAGAVAVVMGADRADVIYSDPPWGPGNQQYWHTMRERGSVPRTAWPGFLTAFCAACAAHRATDAPVFVEMGLRWVDELDAAMVVVGLTPQRRWAITYGSKRHPNVLSLFGPRDLLILLPDPPHGEPVTKAILAAVVSPGMVVLDPCTGLGMTARATHRLGASFRGSEMNAARLAKTEAWLRRAR